MVDQQTTVTNFGGKTLSANAKEALLSEFKRGNNLGRLRLADGLSAAIVAASAPYLSLAEHADEVDMYDPTVGLLLAFCNRTYGTVCGALALFGLGHYSDAEILGRTVYEGSATLAYICLQREARFLQYFQHYLRQEYDQLRRWKAEVNDIPLEQKAEQEPFIDRRERALELYAKIVSEFAATLKIDLGTLQPFPNLLERVGEFGNRLDHRTFYASMCSQSHHDAEDLLNHFIAGSVSDEMLSRSVAETNSFSVFMALFALKYFVNAIGAVSIVLRFSDTTERCESSREYFGKALEEMLPHLENATFPASWQLPTGAALA